MRSLFTCFALSVILAQTGTLSAQQPVYDSTNTGQQQDVQRRKSFAEQLIHERAVLRAHQRIARMEARKRMGVSPLRPNYWNGTHSVDLNRELNHPWLSYAYRPPTRYFFNTLP